MQLHKLWLMVFICDCLGNELSGSGVGTRVAADQYASDTITLQRLVQDVYKDVEQKPLIIAPGGFFDANWFKEFITKSGKALEVITRHIYNLGPGRSIESYIWKFLRSSELHFNTITLFYVIVFYRSRSASH